MLLAQQMCNAFMSNYFIRVYFYLCSPHISIVIVISKSNRQCMLNGLYFLLCVVSMGCSCYIILMYCESLSLP
jgi:hypothetical protein